MPWWQLRMFVEGINDEFGPDEETKEANTPTDDISAFGITPSTLK